MDGSRGEAGQRFEVLEDQARGESEGCPQVENVSFGQAEEFGSDGPMEWLGDTDTVLSTVVIPNKSDSDGLAGAAMKTFGADRGEETKVLTGVR